MRKAFGLIALLITSVVLLVSPALARDREGAPISGERHPGIHLGGAVGAPVSILPGTAAIRCDPGSRPRPRAAARTS